MFEMEHGYGRSKTSAASFAFLAYGRTVLFPSTSQRDVLSLARSTFARLPLHRHLLGKANTHLTTCDGQTPDNHVPGSLAETFTTRAYQRQGSGQCRSTHTERVVSNPLHVTDTTLASGRRDPNSRRRRLRRQ